MPSPRWHLFVDAEPVLGHRLPAQENMALRVLLVSACGPLRTHRQQVVLNGVELRPSVLRHFLYTMYSEKMTETTHDTFLSSIRGLVHK